MCMITETPNQIYMRIDKDPEVYFMIGFSYSVHLTLHVTVVIFNLMVLVSIFIILHPSEN